MSLKKIECVDSQLIINWTDDKSEYMVNYRIRPIYQKLGKYYILWI